MPSRLASYQQMRQISARMVEAAHAEDWERLVELESQVAALRDHLAADSHGVPDSPEDLAQQAQLIRDILAAHEEVAHRARPRLEEIRRLLGDTTSRRRLDQAYGIEES